MNQRFCFLAIFVPGDRLLLIDKFPPYNTNPPISTTINNKNTYLRLLLNEIIPVIHCYI